VAFDAVCFTQDRAGTARTASNLLAAVRARREADVVEVGRGPHAPRGSLGQRARAVEQDLVWYGGRLSRAARAARADVLHCPTFRGPLLPPGLPVAVTVHDLALLREPRWFPRWSRAYGTLAVPRVVRRAARVVCVSRATADDVERLLGVPASRVRVVPNGLDAVFREPLGAPPLPYPYLLFVGTPEPRKNLGGLLAAYRELRAGGLAEALVLVGGGGWGGVRVPDADGVVRLGHVDDRTLRDLYGHATATVYPSFWEGYGLVAVEALAAGSPLVCADVPALREVAGADAHYCDPRSPAAIARAIADALEAPRPERRPGPSWDEAATAVLDVWRELA
jgi:glycosyltransferase involved in cell wall biosynthesis